MEPLTFEEFPAQGTGERRRLLARMPATTGSLLAIGVTSLALAAVYGPVVARLVRTWSIDGNYSHGFLIAPIAVYLVWERRARLASATLRPSNVGLLVVFASLLVLLLGVFSAEVFLTRLSLLGVAAGIVLFVLGWRQLAIVSFPLAFLLLMIPIPAILFNHIALPLQLMASRLGEAVLSLTGVPVLREGNVITLAHARLEVAEACSGIRSLMSLLALAIIYGYFTDRRTWMRIVLALVAVPVAIFVNGLRVAGTGLLAQRFGVAAAEGFFHAFSGWLMFLAAFALLVAIQRVLAAAVPAQAPQRGSRAGDPAGPEPVKRAPTVRLVIVACCLFASAGLVASQSRPERAVSRRPLALLPSAIADWQSQPGPPLDDRTVKALGVDDFVNRVYSIDGQPPVALYVGYYRSQREGDAIHSPLNCLPGAGWEPVARTQTAIPLGEAPGAAGGAIVVNRLVIEKGGDRDLVFYWYQSHGRVVANEYWGRLLLAFDAVRLNRTDGGLVRIIAPVAGNDAAALTASERAARAFVKALFPLLGQYLPR